MNKPARKSPATSQWQTVQLRARDVRQALAAGDGDVGRGVAVALSAYALNLNRSQVEKIRAQAHKQTLDTATARPEVSGKTQESEAQQGAAVTLHLPAKTLRFLSSLGKGCIPSGIVIAAKACSDLMAGAKTVQALRKSVSDT